MADKGFSVKLSSAMEVLVKRLARGDMRLIKSVIERALERYAKLPKEKR